jgi:hypothetical protein
MEAVGSPASVRDMHTLALLRLPAWCLSATVDIQRVFRLLAILLIPGVTLAVAGVLIALATWHPPG